MHLKCDISSVESCNVVHLLDAAMNLVHKVFYVKIWVTSTMMVVAMLCLHHQSISHHIIHMPINHTNANTTHLYVLSSLRTLSSVICTL